MILAETVRHQGDTPVVILLTEQARYLPLARADARTMSLAVREARLE